MNNIDSEQTDTITSDNGLSTIQPIIKKYSHNDKKQLVKRMGDIKNKKCFIKIFKVIHGTTKYTINDNGVLFNLTILPDNILTNIEIIIQYYENKKMMIETQLKNNLNNSSANNNDTEDNISSEIMSTTDKKKITNTANTNTSTNTSTNTNTI